MTKYLPTHKMHDVIIVGAGPIGLLTALELANHGIESVIVTASTEVCHGSRAIVLTRRSQDILHQAGAIEPFIKKGYPWRYGNSFYRGQHVFRMELPHSDNERFMPCLNLQQPYIEQYLIEACEKSGRVQICFGQTVTGHENGVLTLECGEQLRAKYIIAADGGKSFMRKLTGLRMEGRAYAGNFVIVDIEIDLPLPTERLCYFDPEWNPNNNVLLHRQPDGLWRLDYRLQDNETAESALELTRLDASIKSILKMIGHELPYVINWATVYSASTLTLPDYRHGNLFFVGDAAHLLPIFGVRGANTGFMDANNLSWKLAMVLKGKAGDALLNSYSAERVPAAREIIEESGKSTRFMTPPTDGFRLMRDAVLELSLTQNFVKPLLHWRTSKPQSYPSSPLTTNDGATLPNMKFETGFLLDKFVDIYGFSLLIAGEKRETSLPVVYIDEPINGKSVFLIRPDLHIAASFETYDEAKINQAYAKAIGKNHDQ
jgi:3-(3-hydroxy-phenyl)propionate hydroxylase